MVTQCSYHVALFSSHIMEGNFMFMGCDMLGGLDSCRGVADRLIVRLDHLTVLGSSVNHLSSVRRALAGTDQVG